MDYEKDTAIDEQGLDIEWLRQARLMGQYVRHAAKAKHVMDTAQEKLDVCKATTDRDIRAYPDSYELSKLTETIVANTIIIQDGYRKAMKEFLETKYQYDMAVAAVRAIDQKKNALENLVRLNGQNYFAGPSIPRDLTMEKEKHEAQKDSNKKVTLTRRK